MTTQSRTHEREQLEKLTTLKNEVKQLRKFQRDYFQTRNFQLLDICRKQERLVDKMIKDIEDPQTTLPM